MPAEGARRVRVAVLTAPASSAREPGFRVPPPHLDMVDFRELRAPRRASDNRRRGDAALPPLYAEALGLPTFAALDQEVGAVLAEPSFQLPVHALVETASGQLTACLAARALAGIAPDAPLRSVWFASAELAEDGEELASAEVLDVAFVGYKAMLAALLLRRLHRDHPGSVALEGGAPVAPFLVSKSQDLERATGEIAGLASREGSALWPFALEAEGATWRFRTAEGRLAAVLELRPVAAVGEAEEALSLWQETRRPPACVASEAPAPSSSRRWSLAAAALLLLLGGGLGLARELETGAGLAVTPVTESRPVALPATVRTDAPHEPKPRSERSALSSLGRRVPGEAALPPVRPRARAEGPELPPVRPRPRAPGEPELVLQSARSPEGSELQPVRPRARADGPELQPVRPRVRGRPEPAPAAPEVEVRLVSRSGRPVSARLRRAVEGRLHACLASGACASPSSRALEIEVRENLAERANPFLKIGDERCDARRVASCFR